MLVCGEDLGMVPQSVPEIMNSSEFSASKFNECRKIFKQLFFILPMHRIFPLSLLQHTI